MAYPTTWIRLGEHLRLLLAIPDLDYRRDLRPATARHPARRRTVPARRTRGARHQAWKARWYALFHGLSGAQRKPARAGAAHQAPESPRTARSWSPTARRRCGPARRARRPIPRKPRHGGHGSAARTLRHLASPTPPGRTTSPSPTSSLPATACLRWRGRCGVDVRHLEAALDKSFRLLEEVGDFPRPAAPATRRADGVVQHACGRHYGRRPRFPARQVDGEGELRAKPPGEPVIGDHPQALHHRRERIHRTQVRGREGHGVGGRSRRRDTGRDTISAGMLAALADPWTAEGPRRRAAHWPVFSKATSTGRNAGACRAELHDSFLNVRRATSSILRARANAPRQNQAKSLIDRVCDFLDDYLKPEELRRPASSTTRPRRPFRACSSRPICTTPRACCCPRLDPRLSRPGEDDIEGVKHNDESALFHAGKVVCRRHPLESRALRGA